MAEPGRPAEVSIIIPNRNYGRYAVQAVESALHQTHPGCECIVVDYGSTDDSRDLLAGFPIRLLDVDPAGADLAAAFEHGVRNANGELVVMLGADDLLHPRFVERCLAVLRRHPDAGWVYPGAYLFGPHASASGGARFHALPFSRRRLRRHNYILASSLVRRHLLLDLGGYDRSLPVLEDWDLWLRLSEAGHAGAPLDEPLLYYRQHSLQQRNQQTMALHRATSERIIRGNTGRAPPHGRAVRLISGARWRGRKALEALGCRFPAAQSLHRLVPRVGRAFDLMLLPCLAAEAEPRFSFLEAGHSCKGREDPPSPSPLVDARSNVKELPGASRWRSPQRWRS